ncbi:MAG: hypothetical protein COA74_05155 [Gammaproteobacteria bacterium]|nr:MAG: hypothetical protein COA74_05155 [Gammaproteobacteria bacterium]
MNFFKLQWAKKFSAKLHLHSEQFRLSITQLLGVILLLVNFSSQAADLTISTLFGSDSNPHRLMDPFSPNRDDFFYSDLKFKTKFKNNFSVLANIKGASYSDDDSSNWYRGKIDLGYKSKFKVKKKKYKYNFSVDYNKLDSTYISRFTGVEAELSGIALGDRYDANLINANTELSFKTKNKSKFSLGYQYRDKNYQFYDVVGLSNLDYSHQKLSLDYSYPISKNSKLTINSDFYNRNYDDRRNKDLSGANIAGTDLVYNIINIKASYVDNISKSTLIRYSLKYGRRTDNGMGYWDSNSNYASVYFRKRLTDKHILTTSLRYSVFDYDNRSDFSSLSLDEQAKQNNGFKYAFDYRWVFNRGNDYDLAAYVKLQIDSFKSSTSEYEYQRNQISIGLRWDPR